MVMYCQYNFLEVMYWYWYYIFGDMMSNVLQYFLKVMFKALLVTLVTASIKYSSRKKGKSGRYRNSYSLVPALRANNNPLE